MKRLISSISLIGLILGSSASAVQIFSYDLTFVEGPLAGIGGSMATVTTTDGDTPGAFSTWKNISDSSITDFSAMIVINAAGDTIDFDLTNVASGFAKVVGGAITAGTISATITPTPLTSLSLQFNTSTVIVNGTPAGGFSKGVDGIAPKSRTIGVPDNGSTILLLGLSIIGIAALRRRFGRS